MKDRRIAAPVAVVLLCISLVATIAPGPAQAQGGPTLQEQVEQLLCGDPCPSNSDGHGGTPFMAAQHIPGLAVSVVQDGQVILEEGYGSAVLAPPGVAVDADTPFELGSVTKSFTAFAVLLLRDHPELVQKRNVPEFRLDRKIRRYLTDTPGFTFPDAWNALTTRQLLSMSSGMPDGSSNTLPYRTILANTAAAQPPLWFNPGAGYCYSDPSFMLLGVLIHQLSRTPYPAFMRQHVFAPLGMHDTVVHTQAGEPAGLATGYTWVPADDDWKIGEGRDPKSSSAAGAMVSTAHDLALWLSALYERRLLAPNSFDAMWHATSPIPPVGHGRFALGWEVSSWSGLTGGPEMIFGKDGGLPGGFSAYTAYYAADDIAVAIITNEAGVHELTEVIAAIVTIVRGSWPPPRTADVMPPTYTTPPCPVPPQP